MPIAMSRPVPVLKGNLFDISPVSIKPSEHYAEAKASLESIRESIGEVSNSITGESDVAAYNSMMMRLELLEEELSRASINETAELYRAKAEHEELLNRIQLPLIDIRTIIRAELVRYKNEQAEKVRQEEERQKMAEDAARHKLQRQADIAILREQIAAARQAADLAERTGEKRTAEEIRTGLVRFQALDSAPGSFLNPARDASEVRRAVALALQHEQERIKETR